MTKMYKQLLTAPLTPHPAGGTLPVMPAGLVDQPTQGAPDRQPPVHHDRAVDSS